MLNLFYGQMMRPTACFRLCGPLPHLMGWRDYGEGSQWLDLGDELSVAVSEALHVYNNSVTLQPGHIINGNSLEKSAGEVFTFQ